MPHTCHYIPEDEVKMINRRYKICSVILVVLALLFAGSLGFYMYRVIARIHGLENDLIQLNHDLDEVRALGTQVIGQILQPEHHFDEESDEQLPLIRKTIRRTIRKTIRKVMKKMAKKHGCDIKDDVVKDLMDQLTNRNSTTKVPSSLINTVTNRKTGELYDVDHTGDGFTLLHRYRPSDGAVVDSQFWNDNAGMDIEARLKKRTNRRLEELQSTTEIYDPNYDFSDEEDENDDDEYDDQGDYLDYSGEKPSKPEISVDNEYAPATNLTKDAKDGEGRRIVKRSIVAATRDGVLVNSDTYAETKAKNSTHKTIGHGKGKSVSATPARSSGLGYPWHYHRSVYDNTNVRSQNALPANVPITTKKPTVSVRRSRVMSREERPKVFGKLVKKPQLKSGDVEYDNFPSGEVYIAPETTTLRSSIGKHRKLGRNRPLISIQYNGDTSKYVLGKHDNFNGNGHIRHIQRNFVDWVPSDWARRTGMDNHFAMTEGVVTIQESGIYFVYAQIYYLDEHDMNGFRVYKNNNMFLQCTVTQHSAVSSLKGNTCYTAGVEFFSAGDTMFLSDITPGKYSLFEPGKSFFGLVKYGDFKNK